MRIRLTGVAVAMALSATAAVAADDGAPATRGAKPASPPIAFSWLDPYVGGNLGDRVHASERRSGSSRSTFSMESDPRFSNAGDTFANYKFANPWFGIGSGRGGIALDNVLFDGTLGLAYGRGNVTLAGLAPNNLYAVAAGPDSGVDLTRTWSAKAEHLYIDFGGEPGSLRGAGNGTTDSVARLGANWLF
jgi:outer membrane immunogenic protein